MRPHVVRKINAKRAACALGLAAVLGGVSVSSATGQATTTDDPPLRVAIVQLDVVALQSPAGQELQAQLVDFQEELTAEMQALQAAAREIEQRIAEADSLTADESRVLEREYQDAVTHFQRFQQDKQEEANQMRAEGLAEQQRFCLAARLYAALGETDRAFELLEALQTENGYDLVLNAQNDLIVIFSERMDITQLVVDRLQAESGAGS